MSQSEDQLRLTAGVGSTNDHGAEHNDVYHHIVVEMEMDTEKMQKDNCRQYLKKI